MRTSVKIAVLQHNQFGYIAATRGSGGRQWTDGNGRRPADRRADRARGRLCQPSRRPRRADPLRDHRGGGPGARLCAARWRELPRDEAVAIYRRLYWLRPRFDEVAKRVAARRRRAVRHRRQHGAGGRRHLPAARADRAQPQRQGLSRPGARRPHRRRARWPRSTPSSRRAGSAAARPCCCARSRRCRASATCAWPSAGRPTRRSSTAGWRTGLVNRSSRCDVTVNIVNIASDSDDTASAATTFAEGQRLVYGLLAAAAGMFCGARRRGDDRAADVGRLVGRRRA